MMNSSTSMAVEICDVSFKYHKTNVLQNIYANVPKGQIYALLGPSGSGKTTLLRLILGRIKPSSGSITVFGGRKSGQFNRFIGYMPQSQALCPEMTILETLNYFASLYQLSNEKFESQKQILRKVLCLPNDEQIVATLSGGQQKALSLALAFLHLPRFAILDEPTVGIDPVLGDQIWSYLRSNCDQGLTVIIVTHYILEASLAHHVGMMRNGRLIEEGTPQSLYDKYMETNLETIFIRICTEKSILKNIGERQASSYHQNIVNFLSYDTTKERVDSNDYDDLVKDSELDQSKSSMASPSNYSVIWLLFILIRRNLQKFLNSKMTTIMLFSPIFCTLLMCITFKVDKISLRTAVFNEDIISPQYSKKMQQIANGFQVHHIDYKQFNSLREAVVAVERGQAIAAFWFDKNFTPSITKRALGSILSRDKKYWKSSKANQIEMTTTASEGLVTNDENDNFPNTTPNFINKENLSSNQTIASTTNFYIELQPESITTTQMPLITLNETKREPFDILTEKNKKTIKKRENEEEDEEENNDNNDEYDEEEEVEEEEYDDGNFVRLSNETMRSSSIKVYVDNSNMFYALPLIDIVRFASWELMNKVVQDHGHVTLASPVTIKEVVYAEGTETPDFLLSGYMIAFLYLSQVTLSSQLLIQEQKDGFFDRAIVAGAKHWLMFFSHFITNFGFSFIQIGLMFFVGFTWYSIPNFGSYWLAFLLVTVQSASAIMTGLLISALCRENFSAFFIALSITLSQLFSSGAIFPIVSFDPLISFILNITPISMPVESLRNVMLRGWDLTHFRVLHGFITNVFTTFVFGFIALCLFTRRS